MKKKAAKIKPTLKSLDQQILNLQCDVVLLMKNFTRMDNTLQSELAVRAGEAVMIRKGEADIRSLKAETGHHTNRIINLEKDVKSMMPEQYQGAPEPLLTPGISWGTCVGEIKYTEEEKQKEKNKWLSTFARLFKKS